MKERHNGLLAAMRREPEQADFLLKFGLGGPLVIVVWGWLAAYILPAPAIAPLTLILTLVYGGVLAYLVKPVRESDLRPAIEMAMGRFQEIQALRGEIGDLEETLRTRKIVERAKGILMRRYGLQEGEAFSRIQKQARDARKTMREVAEAIVHSDQL